MKRALLLLLASASVALAGVNNPGGTGGGGSSAPSTYAVLTYGTTVTVPVVGVAFQNNKLTLTGNATLAFTGIVSGAQGTIVVVQDSTGGRTLALPSGSKVAFSGNGSIQLSAVPNAIDLLQWTYDGTYYYWNIVNTYN